MLIQTRKKSASASVYCWVHIMHNLTGQAALQSGLEPRCITLITNPRCMLPQVKFLCCKLPIDTVMTISMTHRGMSRLTVSLLALATVQAHFLVHCLAGRQGGGNAGSRRVQGASSQHAGRHAWLEDPAGPCHCPPHPNPNPTCSAHSEQSGAAPMPPTAVSPR